MTPYLSCPLLSLDVAGLEELNFWEGVPSLLGRTGNNIDMWFPQAAL